jgi:FixJ family two-component response regulator
MRPKKLVVMVDDDEMVLNVHSLILKTRGFEVLAYNKPDRLLHDFETGYFTERAVALLITDLEMPELNGNELCRQVKAIDPQVPCLMVTGAHGFHEPMCADRFLRKGHFTIEKLIDAVKTMTARKRGPKPKAVTHAA